jgi:hypothetical protein
VHTLALKTDGTVLAWGQNGEGQCTIPQGLTEVKAIAAGHVHTVALKTHGTVVVWGRKREGQCTIPQGLTEVKAIAAGMVDTVALKIDGTVVAWGRNYGQCTIPEGLNDVKAIAAGHVHTVALKIDGTVVVWGENGEGQCTIPEGLPMGELPDDNFGGIDNIETFLKYTGLTSDQFAELCQAYPGQLTIDGYADSAKPGVIKGLKQINIRTLNLIIRFRKLLNWSFRDLVFVHDEVFSQFAQIKKFSEKYTLPVDVVCSLIMRDMSTNPGFPAQNKPAPKSLFDRIFNTPPFYQGEEYGGGVYHPWETVEKPWDSTDHDPEKANRNQAIRSSLIAALNVGNDDLQAIVDHCSNKDLFDEEFRLDLTKITLNVSTLSRLYRFSKMACALGMRVKEYLLLLRCTMGKDQGVHRLKSPEVSCLDDLSTVEHWADWLKEAELSPYQLKYLTKGEITHEARCRFDPGWTEEGLAQLTPALYATLKPRLIKPESFIQSGTISSVEAAGVTTALLQADLILDVAATEVKEKSSEFMGLVQCPISAASAVSEKFPRVSRLHVIDALRQDAAPDVVVDAALIAARDLVRLKASFPDKQNLTEIQDDGFAMITKTIQVAENTNWEFNTSSDLLKLLEALACGDQHALRYIQKFRVKAEVNPEQFEELCALVIGDKGNEGYFAQQVELGPFVCLAKELGWSFTGLHLVLGSVEGNSLTKETLARVWQTKCLQEKLKIPLDLICNFIMELLTAGGDAVIDIPSFSENLADPGEDKDRASNLAVIRDELLRKAATIQAITDTLNRELDFQMQSTIQQLATTFNANWHEVAITVDYLNRKGHGAAKFLTHDGLRDAGLLIYLAKSLKLSVDAFDAVLKTPSLFGFDSSRSNICINLDTIRSVHAFAGLVETFKKQGYKGMETAPLLADLALRWSFNELTDVDSKTLSTLGGWQESQIRALHGHLGEMSTKGGVTGLATMKRSFDMAAKLSVDVQMLIQLCKLHDAKTNFDEISAAAHSLLGVVKSKYPDDDWEKTFGPIRDNLNERERDALVGLLKYQLSQNKTIGNYFDGMKTLQDLSDYLLLDVEMSGVAKVSVVKQGLNTIQRYIQRCHMGLEGGGGITCPLGDKEWAWRSHYRFWEANRKVFLYPENYLDPDLRKLKTPEFGELQSELLEGEVTADSVAKAYNHYFDRVENLARLKVVSSYYATIDFPGEDRVENTLFLFGRSHTSPPVYYYRKAVLADDRQESKSDPSVISWLPWQRLDLAINAQSLSAIHAFGKLFVFWVEQKEEKKPVTVDGKSKYETVVKATVKYSHQNVSGNWVQPQTVSALEDLIIGINPHGIQDEIDRLDTQLNHKHTRIVGETKHTQVLAFNDLSANFDSIVGPTHFDVPETHLNLTESFNFDEFCQHYVTPQFLGDSSAADAWLCRKIIYSLSLTYGGWQYHRYMAIIHVLRADSGSAMKRWLGGGVTLDLANAIAGRETQYEDQIKNEIEKQVLAKKEMQKKLQNFRDAAAEMGPLLVEKEKWEKELKAIPEWQTRRHLKDGAWTYVDVLKVPKTEAAPERIVMIYGDRSRKRKEGETTQDAPSSFFRAHLLNSELQDKDCELSISIEEGLRLVHDCGYIPVDKPGGYLGVTKDSNKLISVGMDSLVNQSSRWEDILNYDGTKSTLTKSSELLKGLDPSAVVIPVTNQPGWAVLDSGDEQFLILPQGQQAGQVSTHLKVSNEVFGADHSLLDLRYFVGDVSINVDSAYRPKPGSAYRPNRYAFIRLNSNTIDDLSRRMFAGGSDYLLNLDAQLIREKNFSRLLPADDFVTPPTMDSLDFDGAFGIYFREIFFHIPFLIADTLNRDRRFEEAQKWYHHIFSPSPPQPELPAERLVGYWPLDNSAGITSKLAGTSDCQLSGAASWIQAEGFTKNSVRQVLQFDGKTAHVNLGNQEVLNFGAKSFSISAWVCPKSSGFSTVISKSGAYAITLNNERKIGLTHRLQSANVGEETRREIPLDEWSHIGVTFDGRCRIYINGRLELETRATFFPDNETSPVIIGAQSVQEGQDGFFEGSIAEVRIWDVAINSTQILTCSSRGLSDQVWRYLQFRGHTLEKLKDIERTHPQEFKIYTDDPFDPHAIAGLRLGAYEKAIVMKYIDNLLDWGDQLFAQDSWESIVQAMMLYVLAQNLLGKKPVQNRLSTLPAEPLRYDDSVIDKEIDLADPFHVADVKNFPIPANTNFAGYWDRAEDRLFKIRHCINIKGLVRQLALFQPPIDPRQLIRAMAAGQDLTSVAGQLSAPVPHYRFTTMIQQAKNVTSTLTQLGLVLLSALEKKDAEQLNLLRSTHENAILNLTTKIKEKQIDDAGEILYSLQASLDSAKERRLHYQMLIDKGLSNSEKSGIESMDSALTAMEAGRIVRGAAIAAHLIPTIEGTSFGGWQPGSSVSEAASFADAFGGIRSHQASMIVATGQNERRAEEWELQKALGEHDVEQINAQIEGAKIRQEIAQLDLDIHQKSIEQSGEMEDLLLHKFTNRDLYQWMVGRISSVYFQTYKIAFDLAQSAEKAYQYERNTDETLITFGYWDSLKKGLLAGEGLMLGLNQLEKAYMDDNERTLEIEKIISLNQLDVFNGKAAGTTIDGFKKTTDGKSTFNLSEKLFDQDFPGHYCRKIKSITITIPAVVGPYQNVQATLRQTINRVLLKPDPKGVAFLTSKSKDGGGASDASNIRSDWRRQQHIAISKGVNDSGLFELNFRDERYLPFEGTGAVSDWTLDMRSTDKEVLATISDVIIHLRYTAKDGGEEFRTKVVHALLELPGNKSEAEYK